MSEYPNFIPNLQPLEEIIQRLPDPQDRQQASQLIEATRTACEQHVAYMAAYRTALVAQVQDERSERLLVEAAFRRHEERFYKFMALSPEAIIESRNGRFTYANPAMLRLLRATEPSQVIGKTAYDLVAPHYADSIRQRLAYAQMNTDALPVVEHEFIRFDGTSVDVEVATVASHDQDDLVMQSIVREISSRKKVDAKLRQQDEILDTFHETMVGLLNRLDVHSVLDAIVARAGQLLDTEDVILYILDAELDVMEAKIGKGASAAWVGYRIPRGSGGFIDQIWKSSEPFTIGDYNAWQHRLPEVSVQGHHALLGVPLCMAGGVVGVLGLHRNRDRPFSANEIALIARFGQLAALVLQNARLYDAAKQELDERRRIEAALRDSEARLHRLVDHLPAGAVYVHADEIFLNPYAQAIIGAGQQDIASLQAWFTEIAMQSGATMHVAGPVTRTVAHPDGGLRVIEFTGYREGEIAVWLLRDVTASERLARLMAQTERAALIGGWELNIATGQLYWTAAMHQILETDPATFVVTEENLFNFQRGEMIESVREAIHYCRETGDPISLDLEQSTFSGRRIWTRMTANVEFHDGAPSRLYGSLQDITDAKRIEHARLLSEERLQLAIESTEDALWDWNILTDELFMSPRWAQMLGYREDEIPEQLKGTSRYCHPNDWPLVNKKFQQHLAGKSVQFSSEHRLRHQQGHWVWVQAQAKVVNRDAVGKPTRLVGTLRDISYRKQVEEALRESELRFRQLAEHVDAVFWLTEADSQRLLYVSPAYERLWQRPAANLYKHPTDWLEGVHPADRTRVHETITAQRLSGEYDVEYRLLQPDGAVRWVRDRSFSVQNEDGKISRVVSLSEDITERKQQQDELNRQRNEMRQMLDAVNAMVWLLDAQGRIVRANHMAQRISQEYPNEVANRTLAELFPNDPDVQSLFEQSLTVVATQQAQLGIMVEWQIYEKMRWSSVDMIPLFDDNDTDKGRVSGVLVFVYGITELKQAEAEIRALNAQLEERVQARTAELASANDALRQSETRLRALLEAMPDMVFRISRSGKFLDFSAAQGAVTLLPRDQIIGTSIHDLPLSTDAIRESLNAYEQALATGAMQTVEYSMVTDEGIEYFESRIVRSGPDEIVSIIRNITERTAAATALRESEERFRSIFEQAAVGIAHVQLDGRFLLVNQRFCEIVGFARTELMALSIAELTHADDLPSNTAAVERLIGSKTKTFSVEIRYRHKSGRHVWVNVTVSLVRRPSGEPNHLISVIEDIDRRRRAEDALRASEDKFAKIFYASPLPKFITRVRDNQVLDVNDHCLELLGCTRQEILNASFEMIEHWHLPFMAPAIAKQLQTEGSIYNWETLIRTNTGEQRNALLSAETIELDGEPCVLWAATDITEQKRISQALSMSEQRLRQIIDLVPHMIFAKDVDGRFILANQAMAAVFEMTPDQLIAKSDLDLTFDTPEYQKFRNDDREVLTSGRSKYIPEETVTDAAGRVRIWRTIKIPFTFSGADTPAVLGVSTDITELRQTEIALSESEARFRQFAEHVPFVVFMLAVDTRELIYINAAYEKVFGEPLTTVYRNPMVWLRRVHPADRPALLARLRTLDASSSEYEFRIILADGQTRWLDFVHIPILNEHGEYTLFTGIAEDITLRKVAEQQSQRWNEELEERVRQRTVELEVANQEMESFSYSVSHDLRAPLRAISGFSQALLEDYSDAIDAEGKHYLVRVRAASQRMAALIDDLLTLSRVSRQEMQRAPVNLSALATEIADDLHASQPERHVEFIIATDLWVDGDFNLLRVVLDNLLRNAWKYTGNHAHARIEFGIQRRDARPVYFVRDDGAGFDMTYADKLFGAFQRLHRESEFEGTGVGLATVQRIIHRHGGRVWADGAVDQGATFYFTLA